MTPSQFPPLEETTNTDAVVTNVFRDRQEHIHPDKIEYMVAGRFGMASQHDPRAVDSVKVLGAMIDTYGGARRDTANRMEAAAKS